jgi:phosphatidylserine synthase
VFITTAIYRLIRFTASGFAEENDSKYYVGIPVVFSHFLVVIALLLSIIFGQYIAAVVLGILLLGLSFAMVSRIRLRKPLSSVLYCLLVYLISLSAWMIYLGLRLK